MSDLVERLRKIGAHYSACDRQQTIYEAADALEAAQARIEAVRRETVAEMLEAIRGAVISETVTEKDPIVAFCDGADAMEREIAAVIRALTEAKEDHIPDARKMVEAKEDRT